LLRCARNDGRKTNEGETSSHAEMLDRFGPLRPRGIIAPPIHPVNEALKTS
jgi:hypothetical protein